MRIDPYLRAKIENMAEERDLDRLTERYLALRDEGYHPSTPVELHDDGSYVTLREMYETRLAQLLDPPQ